MSKALLKEFKYIQTPFSKIEAAFSLQCDFDQKKDVSVAGYAKLWMWSRKKVKNFLQDMGVEIIYPDDTQKKQNQKGQIGGQIRDRSGADKEQIRLIDSTWLKPTKNRKGTDKEQIRSRSGNTTKDPDPNLNPNPKQKPKKQYRDYVFLTEEEHGRLTKDFGESMLNEMMDTLDNYIGAMPKKRNKYTDHNRVLRGWVAKSMIKDPETPLHDPYKRR